MEFKLPELPYAYNALEPYIDEQTMIIHHTKHHQTYTDKLNAAVKDKPELNSLKIEDLLKEKISSSDLANSVRNNGGGFYNHSVFWTVMAPHNDKKVKPEAELNTAIESAFGDFEQFKQKFTNTAVNRFGSGWAWLVINNKGKLDLYDTPNQDSPVSKGDNPLLCLDVWEHAYYLKYQNRRPEYIDAWWNVVNWEEVEKNYKKFV